MVQDIERYIRRVGHGDYIEGVTLVDPASGKQKCHRFGGVPYALPPRLGERWRRSKPLPQDYVYGTREQPGKCTALSATCPQAEKPTGRPHVDPQTCEDCLQCNIWLPVGEPPDGGWPVWVYLHGGFLQFGSPNKEDPSNLLCDTEVRCIIVMPVYRLNVFGFLACQELLDEVAAEGGSVGNLGFWDQRLALDWTYGNIERFGGNKHNMTLGGMSAGAHSAFHQLAYELGLPDKHSIIRRVVMWSNGAGVQPKSLSEVQDQFDELIEVLRIPRNLDAQSKLARLRALSPEQLIGAIGEMKQNSFRAVTDGRFVRKTLFQEIDDGRFAKAMLRRGIRIMIGDLPDEANVYKLFNPPSSYIGLVERLNVEYPRIVSQALAKHYSSGRNLQDNIDWVDIFGRIFTDVQIHMTACGLLNALTKVLPLSYIHRYRINWRAKCVDIVYPKEMGVTHGSDIFIWFYGNGARLSPPEQQLIGQFLKPFAAFLKGEEVEWPTKSIREARGITSSGSIEILQDGDWERCLEVCDALRVSWHRSNL